MKIIGIDFTSAPCRRKPITCSECSFDGETLNFVTLHRWPNFGLFDDALKSPGPWIAAIDFPFGQSRKLVSNLNWPDTWAGYVAKVSEIERSMFRTILDGYRSVRPFGDKEHRRQTDIAARAISPQKLYGIPVGLMFFEGAPRLLRSGATIAGLHKGALDRTIVEAYPGVLARSLIGRNGYKHDTAAKQTIAHHIARSQIVDALQAREFGERFGFAAEVPQDAIEDPTGDALDAHLCAIQAAWAWSERDRGFGFPDNADRLEGWISDPSLLTLSTPPH